MKIKRISSIKINCYNFNVVWDKTHNGGYFTYSEKKEINIGVKGIDDDEIFMLICHELMEIVACEANVRLSRPDVGTDYIFVYDHRQHDTMMNMFSGLVSQFIR